MPKILVKMAFWLQEKSVVFWGCSENIWSWLLNMVSYLSAIPPLGLSVGSPHWPQVG